MTTQYAIIAFPEFEDANAVEALRHAFDPQAALLPAHITFVFPFVATPSDLFLREHIESCLVGISPFDIRLAPPSPEADGYLFLRVASGRDRIVDVHARLYSGPLEPRLSTSRSYEPHITLGHLDSPESLETAVATALVKLPNPLSGHIDRVHLFRIEGGRGQVELSFPLVGSLA